MLVDLFTSSFSILSVATSFNEVTSNELLPEAFSNEDNISLALSIT